MAALVCCAHAQNYTITDLGVPGGNANSASEGHALNRNGAVVGTWWDGHSAQGSQYAFSYSGGTILDLGTLKSGGYDYAVAYGVNNLNQIVGQATTSGAGNYKYHAFLYTNGVMFDLDTTGQNWSSANAINQLGQIVGEFTTVTNASAIHAFLFTNGIMQDLGTLPGGGYSSARGINDLGVIVGDSADVTGNTYAFVCSNRVMTGLGTLGGSYSSARAINNSGVIVGESTTTNGDTHAFIYRNGVMTDLGTLGGTNSSASAINNGGEVIGYALTAGEDAHVFSYDGVLMKDLHQAVALPSGWTNVPLTLGYGLNDAGQVVGGINYVTGGVTNYRAFLITPPPITLSCSTNITTTASSPAGAIINYSVSATGGCSTATLSANLPSGALFPVGTNIVNITAADLCGHTNTCSFTAVVFPPVVVTCPSNISTIATSPAGAQVLFDVTATGGCSTHTITTTPSSGDILPIGTNIVTAIANDACGNTNSCTFTVTVYPPVSVTCSTNIEVRATGPGGAQVFYNASANGGCSVPTLSANPPSGATFPAGTNVVSMTAFDTCGNTNACSFTIIVDPPLTPVSLGSPSFIAGGPFQLSISGIAGQRFAIFTSTNLINWDSIFTNTLLSSSTNFVDYGAPPSNARFYRAITLP